MTASTTITILDARLRLVHIPREQLQALMAPIIDCWWFRGETDPFFSLCVNQLEVSLFADASVVRKTFGDWLLDGAEESDREDEDSDEDDESDLETTSESWRHDAGESGITLGAMAMNRPRVPRVDHDEEAKRRSRLMDMDERGEDRVKVDEEVWIALEIAFHGDGWEDAGRRVRELSSPLADAAHSIMYLSTYGADFILVKASALESVTAILQSSGFQFAADSDSDDEILSPLVGSVAGLSRQSSLRLQRGNSTSSSPGGRLAGSLSGSLTLSDNGSVGSKGSVGTTMSRSASAARAAAASARRSVSTAARSAAEPSFGTAVAPLSPPQSAPTSPPTTMSTLPSLPSTFTAPADSVSLLPDELVCVGLAQGEQEKLWRSKIVTAIFFPERVLPNQPTGGTSTSTSRSRIRTHRAADLHPGTEPLLDVSRKRFGSSTYGTNLGASDAAVRSSSSSNKLQHSTSSLPTAQSDYPVPFIALTQTLDGTSLTGDVRLLRAVFNEQEEGDMVYAVGAGGLRGIWQGEDSDSGEDADADAHVNGDGDGDEYGHDRGRRRTSASARARATVATGSLPNLGDESDASGAEWERVERREFERERMERRARARAAGDGGRRLLKCLQLDLVAFGLDKHGIVESVAGILGEAGINCLYQSTYSSANILVSKCDITRAQRAIERYSQQTVTA